MIYFTGVITVHYNPNAGVLQRTTTHMIVHTVVKAGNLILGKLGTQFPKNHCDFHAQWIIHKSKISILSSIFEQIFSKMQIIFGK